MNNFAIIAHHDIGARNKPTKSSRMKRVNAFRKELLKHKICFSEEEVRCEDLPRITTKQEVIQALDSAGYDSCQYEVETFFNHVFVNPIV
ncbi:hypothetical protein A2619_01120 [candidate division WWE3 bacterium RIFOXYD1_FULL_39_9]|uniref:Uncharacterized protein n=1 Tax=candidate division WWE3 bacterium RIFOXYD1_FULL_39_9 TaxID=1802649 RepID=A0A1F4X686_UNCKA|nr:MAG: hypothetical protein A2619_01120 [candidate division WWE3 bacterium RIFOXYD1_FULL_39_9]